MKRNIRRYICTLFVFVFTISGLAACSNREEGNSNGIYNSNGIDNSKEVQIPTESPDIIENQADVDTIDVVNIGEDQVEITPIEESPINNHINKVIVGDTNPIILTDDGTVWMWGSNSSIIAKWSILNRASSVGK